jgi:hypothetical protein
VELADWSVGRCGPIGHSIEVKKCLLLKCGVFIVVKIHVVVFWVDTVQSGRWVLIFGGTYHF